MKKISKSRILRNNLKLSRYVIRLIGGGIFLYIISLINFSEFMLIVQGINWFYIATAAFFMVIQLVVKSERWRSISKIQNINIPLYSTIRINAVAGVFGMVTPGRLGEFVKIRFVRNYSSNLMDSWIGILIDRLFDLIILFIVGSISLVYLTYLFSIELYSVILSTTIFSLVIILFFKHFNNVFLIIVKNLVSKKVFSSIKSQYNKFQKLFLETLKYSFNKSFIFTIISFLTQCITSISVVYSLGLSIPLYFIAVIISVSTLASLLPISVGGFGTREGIYIFLLRLHGISIESALTFSLINGVIISTLFVGLIAFGFWSINRFSIEF